MTKKLFLENKYTKWYFSIIENAKSKPLGDYMERHHIITKCMNGNNSTDNLVPLTAKEHFICHLLLTKMVTTEYKKKMNYSYWRMCNGSVERYKPSSRFYMLGKKAFIESQTGHPSYLLSHSAESRNLISVGMKNTLSLLSKEMIRQRMANSCCKPEVYTKERVSNISKSTTGVKKTKTEKLLQAEENRKESRTIRMIEYGKLHKGKTWKLIDGKRVWIDKETQNY